jgi:hypothetical protein
MTRTPVTIHDNPELSRLEAVLETGEVTGFSQYRKRTDKVYSFVHTEVDDRFEGGGIGGQIAAGVMQFARDKGVQIVPTCSFIRAYMRRHADTHDLLAPGASLKVSEGETPPR